jgi:alkanesulfonate monooxygenase SsuD/methylene tetrahydromethanopterin reductase-like flavin-dependent oxidoreductase (luciferase family)
MGVRIGIFDHLDRGDTPLDEYYEARLRLVEAYDRAGFYSYHIAEHHATPLGMAPSPSIFLSAVAQRTKRLRFGPMVYLLPLYHPIRLAEEIAMLDNLSNGRLDVGIGRGISPIESTLYGRDPQENEERFNEVLDILKIAFSGGRIDYDGKHYTFHNVSMLLGTVQQPHPPFWYGISSPDSAERCVARDFNGVSLAATPKALRTWPTSPICWSESVASSSSVRPTRRRSRSLAVRIRSGTTVSTIFITPTVAVRCTAIGRATSRR